MIIYTLSTVSEDYDMVTTVHKTYDEAMDCLIENFASDEDVTRDTVMDFVLDQGVLASVQDHILN